MMLHRYIGSCARTPFAYGQHDCATFVTGWVQEATGRDITGGLKGRYKTLVGGIRQVRKLGHADHVALITAHLPERTSRAQAMIGDIVVAPGETGPALGICCGDHAKVLAEHGLVSIDMAEVQRVFEVTHV